MVKRINCVGWLVWRIKTSLLYSFNSFFSLSVFSIIRLPRQSIQPCNDRSDCYPDGVTFVPTNLINCIDNRCFCDQCFTRNTTGQCGMTIPSPATCYYYDEQSDQCVDNRKSQLVAFILSLTLSGVGVANFYIGQNGLAAGQLVLFFSIFLIICFAVCIPCCAVCCLAQTEDVKVCDNCVFVYDHIVCLGIALLHMLYATDDLACLCYILWYMGLVDC